MSEPYTCHPDSMAEVKVISSLSGGSCFWRTVKRTGWASWAYESMVAARSMSSVDNLLVFIMIVLIFLRAQRYLLFTTKLHKLVTNEQY